MAAPSITIIGSLNTDMITRTPRIPSGGETLLSQSFTTGSGGKGANQAVACARLSRRKPLLTARAVSSEDKEEANISMIGAIGSDHFGKDLVRGLDENGISTDGIMTKEGENSGVAVIIIEESTGENRILLSPNANYSLSPSSFTTLPLPLPDILILQLEIPLDTTLQILRTARDLRDKVSVIMNPAPAQALPREAYEAITHLIVNESEASILTSPPQSQSKQTEDSKNPDWTTWGPHTETLLALGVPHIIVTLGGQGVLYLSSQSSRLMHIPAEKVKVKDTTAAGDTFVGAYAVAVARGGLGRVGGSERVDENGSGREGESKQKPEEGENGQEKNQDTKGDFEAMARAVVWANKAAALTVQREGAQSAIPWLDEVVPYADLVGAEGREMSFEDARRGGRIVGAGG